jgi:hypothetical protein
MFRTGSRPVPLYRDELHNVPPTHSNMASTTPGFKAQQISRWKWQFERAEECFGPRVQHTFTRACTYDAPSTFERAQKTRKDSYFDEDWTLTQDL